MKRTTDILIAAIALVLLSPMLIIVAVILLSQMGSPILFRQTRPGLHGKPFQILKFRSMRNATSSQGVLLDDSERLTRFGSIIRATSIDELPALWNVLKGEMSLVGPRPLLMDYLKLYSKEQARRHEVRPGITGWAQVNGRNAITWDEKFSLDVWYVDNHTFLIDLKIIWMTINKVLKREGISAVGEATMPRFKGNK